MESYWALEFMTYIISLGNTTWGLSKQLMLFLGQSYITIKVLGFFFFKNEIILKV